MDTCPGKGAFPVWIQGNSDSQEHRQNGGGGGIKVFQYKTTKDETIQSLFGLGRPEEEKVGKDYFPVIGGFKIMKENGHWTNFPEQVKSSIVAGNLQGDVVPAGTEFQFSWNHLKNHDNSGLSLHGNFAGPGGSGNWYTRPVHWYDLAAKLHDFAYEVNGLSFEESNQPLVYWSRRAKADTIFRRMTDGYKDENVLRRLKTLLVQNIGKYYLKDRDDLFLSNDGFINPLVHIPDDWLMIPYEALHQKPPKIHEHRKRRSVKRGKRSYTSVKTNYWDPTEEDQPGSWKERLQSYFENSPGFEGTSVASLESITNEKGNVTASNMDYFWKMRVELKYESL